MENDKLTDAEDILTCTLFGNVDEENVLDAITIKQLRNFAGLLQPIDIFRDENVCDSEDTAVQVHSSFADSFSDCSPCSDTCQDDDMLDNSNAATVTEPKVESVFQASMPNMQPMSSNGSDSEGSDSEAPLAGMLPEEYRGYNVSEFFPDFKRSKVLRFSRLFGPGKPSNMPMIWRNVKSRRRVEETGDSTEAEPAESRALRKTYAPRPSLEECNNSDETFLLNPLDLTQAGSSQEEEKESLIPQWRYGPAVYWYDRMNVPPTGEGFNYNMRLKVAQDKRQTPSTAFDKLRPEFLPVNINHWENDFILFPEAVEEEVKRMMSGKQQPICAWIPTPMAKDFDSFLVMFRNNGFANMLSSKWNSTTYASDKSLADTKVIGSTESIFPAENGHLMRPGWEEEVITDPDNMSRIPEPTLAEVDHSEVPEVFGLPEDVPRDDGSSATAPLAQSATGAGPAASETSQDNKNNDRKVSKKSQVILGRVVQRKLEEDEDMIGSQLQEKDKYNLSNDEYYLPKGTSSVSSFGSSTMQHSIPAQNLMRVFFPTFMGVFKLRHFHRMPLRRYGRGVFGKPGFHVVHSLEDHVRMKKQEREQERIASGGGDMFYMREPEDLSGKDGDLIFVEFSEEHPPLLCQPGMSSKIKNYNKRRPGKESVDPKFEYGETAYTHTTPFLGSLLPGQSMQALENHLFRAPIYRHEMPATDFLVIRTRQGYWIRRVNTIFCVGQEFPLFEVPSPNSKRASNFIRDFLLVFIYRLFWESTGDVRKIRMEDVRRAFPHYAESSIRKRLKICSDFKRLGQGPEANFWVLREDFRLPNLEELRLLLSPEMCCAYYSMLAAEQRLKDAGYGEKYFFTPEEDEEDDCQAKMADEIKCAPWNTTRAYIAAAKAKCLLDVTGVADPTGIGEGYSFVKLSSKPPREDLPPPVKKTVTGTDADLRKLSLKDAKQLLRDFGVNDDEIKTLSRWEIIDVIRTLSTQQARAGGSGITKFARGNMRFSVSEVQERYKQDCQRIFELQNKVLSNTEVLSTDNEESEADDSDIEEMGKNIENMLVTSSKKPVTSYSMAEEKEREELQKLLSGQSLNLPDEMKKVSSSDRDNLEGKKLKITRTFRNNENGGGEHVTIEYVTKPQLIEAYSKIRTTKDEAFIRNFAHTDEQYREERRREKRRLQDQLRRIRRNEIKAKMGVSPTVKPKPSKPPPPPKPSLLKMRCSACGAKGHMKTNKNCPLYGQVKYYAEPVERPEEEARLDESLPKMPETDQNLVSVEGTKVKLSKLVVEHAEKLKKAMKSGRSGSFSNKIIIRRRSGDYKNAGDNWTPRGKGSVYSYEDSEEEADDGSDADSKKITSSAYMEYLQNMPRMRVNRRRADPKVTMAAILETIVKDARNLPYACHFLLPVSKKLLPDYYRLIQKPMDMQKILLNIAQYRYVTREQFLTDFRQILDNSMQYNGEENEITTAALHLFAYVSRRVAERESRLMKLEKAINPLLDDDDQVAFSYMLKSIIEKLKSIPKSFPFYQPVDGRKIKTYYDRVRKPMDLGTMEKKAEQHMYTHVVDFLMDIEQIYKNSELFNGPASTFTIKAKEIYDTAIKLVQQEKAQLIELENLLNATKQKALDAAEVESLTTGGLSGSMGDDRDAEGLKKTQSELQFDLLLSDSDEESHGPSSPTTDANTDAPSLPTKSPFEGEPGSSSVHPLFDDLQLSDSDDDEPPTKVAKEDR